MELIGFPTDPAKDSDEAREVNVLGTEVLVDTAAWKACSRVQEAKARKWHQQIVESLESLTLSDLSACQLGGR